jgi:hypothetical protein
MFIKLVQHQAHTIHKAVHVSRFTFRISGPTMGSQSSLEFFKIVHPLQRKVVWLDVCFVKNQDEREFGFVKDAVRQGNLNLSSQRKGTN